MKYSIYQIKDLTKDRVFTGLEKNETEIDLKKDAYEKVYEKSIDLDIELNGDEIFEFLKELHYIFNVCHPQGYKSRSLSLSDIVQINDKYYYCDNYGWTEISVL